MATPKFLKKLSTKIKAKNEYSFFADDENSIYNIKEYVDTGVYAINAIISDGDIFKGIAKGKRLVFAGASSTAKSYFTSILIKAWLAENDENFVIFGESEGATISEMLTTLGVDKTRVYILPLKTIEDTRIQFSQVLEEIKQDKSQYGKCLFVLDSLGMLSSVKEISDSLDGKNTKDMTKAAQVKALFRTITLDISLTQSAMITVTHSYNTQEMFSKQIASGGEGVVYAGDALLFLSKAKEKDGTEQTGVTITLTNAKSRFIPENQKVKVQLSFKRGINKYSYLMELGLDTGAIIKEGNSYIFPDGEKYTKRNVIKNIAEIFTGTNLEVIRTAIQKKMSFGDGSDDVDLSIEEEEVEE